MVWMSSRLVIWSMRLLFQNFCFLPLVPVRSLGSVRSRSRPYGPAKSASCRLLKARSNRW